MPWVKDVHIVAPRIAYIAPPEVYPMTRIIFNPKAKAGQSPWVVEYAWVNTAESTLAAIEALMGL